MADKYERLDRKLEYQGNILDIYSDYIKLPNENVVKWDYIHHIGAAAVVPVTAEGKILMVKQYRNALDRFTLELPAGKRDSETEDTLETAERELEEETGYKCAHIEKLVSLRSTVAFCNELIDVYLATDLIESKQNLDDDEFIDVQAYEVSELLKMIQEGTIQDAKTVSGILAYQLKILTK